MRGLLRLARDEVAFIFAAERYGDVRVTLAMVAPLRLRGAALAYFSKDAPLSRLPPLRCR